MFGCLLWLEDQSVVHLVLMIILVVGGLIGCTLTAWWIIPGFRNRLPGRNISPDDFSPVSIYENLENSLRDSSSSDTTFEGSIHGGNEHCDIQAIIISKEGESETEYSEINNHEDNNYSGVFTIRILTHHLIQEEQPCIMIETNSHSEA